MDKTTTLKSIPISQITIKDRDRIDYGNKEEWENFKSDIEQHGLYSAISVQQINEKEYLLLAGGRRTKACSELGHSHINATIYTGDLDETDMKIVEINENLKRKSLGFQEEVESKKKLYDLMVSKYGEKRGGSEGGVSQAMVAKMLGETPANFSYDLQLAKAIPVLPTLAQAKTKTEALNALKKGIKEHREEKAVTAIKTQIKKEQKEKKIASPRDYLISNYKVGDFFTGVKEAVSGMCSLVEIDPPYAVRLDKQKKKETISDVTADYNEVSEIDYPKFMKDTLREAYRILKDNGWLVLWFGPEPWFEDMYNWAIEAGFLGNRLAGVWVKGYGQTQHPSIYMANSYETFFYFRKSPDSELNKPGRANTFIYKPISPTLKIHPTERPIELTEDMFSTFVSKGTIICSTFLGSGNSLLSANNLECKAYGWDLTEKYKDKFTLKVHNTPAGEKFRSY